MAAGKEGREACFNKRNLDGHSRLKLTYTGSVCQRLIVKKIRFRNGSWLTPASQAA